MMNVQRKRNHLIHWLQLFCRALVTVMLSFIPYTVVAGSLPADKVFKPSIVDVDTEKVTLAIDIMPGYYLYRERLFSVKSATDTIKINAVNKSQGINKDDPFFGEQSVWKQGQALIEVYYRNPDNIRMFDIFLAYQGCHDGVLCYPPQKQTVSVQLPDNLAFEQQRIFNNDYMALQGSQQKNATTVLRNYTKESGVLTAEEAFSLTVTKIDDTKYQLQAQVADRHYLYKNKFAVSIKGRDGKDIDIGSIQWDQGDEHYDDFFGNQQVYYGASTIAVIELTHPLNAGTITVTYQGCAERGICYPLMKSNFAIQSLASIGSTVVTVGEEISDDNQQELDYLKSIENVLTGNIWLGIALLLLAGAALSFTPCVLPMLPILLGIITNQGDISKLRALSLSLAYAFGVAAMMAVFGIVVASTGINIQIIFQNPLWIVIFASVFALLGLAMLGVFTIAMPYGIQNKVAAWQSRFKNTNVVSVFVVGALSTLVVGPCVAPPLIAVLAFISTTGDSTIGAIYLFALGFGMSLPLVVFSSLFSRIPKTGAFSVLVTRLFAMLMFGVGLWLVSRLIPGTIALMIWGVFLLINAILLWKSRLLSAGGRILTRFIAISVSVVGMSWIVGGFLGSSNPLHPFTKTDLLPVEIVHSQQELETILQQTDGVVMLDFYADWCVSCQEFKHFTLTDNKIKKALEHYRLLKVDITSMTDEDTLLLKQFNLIGPPAVLFFKDGKELQHLRVLGAANVEQFSQHLLKVYESTKK